MSVLHASECIFSAYAARHSPSAADADHHSDRWVEIKAAIGIPVARDLTSAFSAGSKSFDSMRYMHEDSILPRGLASHARKGGGQIGQCMQRSVGINCRRCIPLEGRLMVVGHTRASCRTSARLYLLKGVVPSERKCDQNVSSGWSGCGTKCAAIGAPHGYDHGSHHYSCRSVAWRRRLVRSRSLVWPLILEQL
jgi:hypothetical protein